MNGLFSLRIVARRRSLAFAVLAASCLVAIPTVHAGKGSRGMSCCSSPPEMWVINTRCAPRCSNLDQGFEMISYQRYDRCRGTFVKESRESFLAGEATMPTLFYIHGNSLNQKGAMKGFWDVYEHLRCCPGPKRLVCWSWPAERVYKTEGLRVREMIRKNLRIKYVYAEHQGYYLAKLVSQMSLSQRVTLSGHSYGAITSAVALHLLGDGCVRGMTLEGGAPVERANLRGVMISAAFDCDMLYPGHRYGQAFVAAEKILSTFNPHDRTLRKWPRKASWRGCEALGYSGMSAARLGQYRPKFWQVNTYPENGRSHYLGPHLNNPRFMSAYCCMAFGGLNTFVPMVTSTAEESEVEILEPVAEKPLESEPGNPGAATEKAAAQKEDEPTLAEPVGEEVPGEEPASDSTPAVGKAATSGSRASHLRSRNRMFGSRR